MFGAINSTINSTLISTFGGFIGNDETPPGRGSFYLGTRHGGAGMAAGRTGRRCFTIQHNVIDLNNTLWFRDIFYLCLAKHAAADEFIAFTALTTGKWRIPEDRRGFNATPFRKKFKHYIILTRRS
jgi:hypothetical protein